MYKFVVVSGSCGGGYDIGKAEKTANDMAQNGYVLVETYQTTTPGCNGSNSSLVLIFRRTK